MTMPGYSANHQALTIEAGSGSFDRAYFPDYLTRDSNSNEDLRLSEIADAMVDVQGKDQTDSHCRARANDFDESPEDLSVSSADSSGSGRLPASACILSQPAGTSFPIDFDPSSLGSGLALDSNSFDSS